MLNYHLRFKIIQLCLASAIFSLLFLPGTIKKVDAQAVGLSLEPAISYVAIQPGKSMVITYRLENLADPAIARFMVRPFQAADTNGEISISDKPSGPISFTIINSDSFIENPFFLRPKEQYRPQLRIEVPSNTPEKDYYYSLIIESDPPPPQEGVTSARIKTLTAANLLITVTRDSQVEIAGKIIKLDLQPRHTLRLFGKTIRIIETGDKIPVEFIIENTGRNFIRPMGEINIHGSFGGRAVYPFTTQTVLARSQRKFTVTLNGFFIGPYKVSTRAQLAEGAPIVFAESSFLALPVKPAIIVILVGGAVGLWYVRGKNHRHKD